jgi:hypothetical protein
MRTPLLRIWTAIALVSTAGLVCAAFASADPPSFAQGESEMGADGSGDIWISDLPVAAPFGVLIRTTASSDGRSEVSGTACPKAGGVSWWYDTGSWAAGQSFGYGPGFDGSTNEPDFAVGTSYSLSLPPQPPFNFTGTMPDGESCPGTPSGQDNPIQAVAFVAPANNTYHLDLGLSSRSFKYNVDGGSWQTVTSTTGIDLQLSAGLHVIYLGEGNAGATGWTVSGDDLPPTFARPSASRPAGVAGQTTMFSLTASESGAVNVDVLRNSQVIRSLVSGHAVGLGRYAVSWDGKLLTGDAAAPGQYVVRFTERDWRGREVAQTFPYKLIDLPLGLAPLAPYLLHGYAAPRRIPDSLTGRPAFRSYGQGYRVVWGSLQLLAAPSLPIGDWKRAARFYRRQVVGGRQVTVITGARLTYVWTFKNRAYAVICAPNESGIASDLIQVTR